LNLFNVYCRLGAHVENDAAYHLPDTLYEEKDDRNTGHLHVRYNATQDLQEPTSLTSMALAFAATTTPLRTRIPGSGRTHFMGQLPPERWTN
jgi:pyrrolidone-carboxylate peptidase